MIERLLPLLFLVAAASASRVVAPLSTNTTDLDINTPPMIRFGLQPFAVVANVSLIVASGCETRDWANFTSGTIAVVRNREICENSRKATHAAAFGATGMLIIEATSAAKLPAFSGQAANTAPINPCNCSSLPIAFILDRDWRQIETLLTNVGFATLSLTSDTNEWVTMWNGGAFWFFQLFFLFVNLGCVVAGIIRLKQFADSNGACFQLTVPQVTIVLELIASLARFISLIDPFGSRGLVTTLGAALGRQIPIALSLMTHLLTGLFWLEMTRRYADLTVSPWLKRFKLPFIIAICVMIVLILLSAFLNGFDLRAAFGFIAFIDVVDFVLFTLAAVFYEVLGIRIYRKVKKMSATGPKDSRSGRKLDVVKRTVLLLAICSAFMLCSSYSLICDTVVVVFSILYATQIFFTSPAGTAGLYFGLFGSMIGVSLTKLIALRRPPRGLSGRTKRTSTNGSQLDTGSGSRQNATSTDTSTSAVSN